MAKRRLYYNGKLKKDGYSRRGYYVYKLAYGKNQKRKKYKTTAENFKDILKDFGLL